MATKTLSALASSLGLPVSVERASVAFQGQRFLTIGRGDAAGIILGRTVAEASAALRRLAV